MIVDTHTHFYDPTRPQGVPWPSPAEAWLYRPVLPAHFRALAEPCGVTGTVVVEASAWEEDNQWVLDLAAADPFLLGLIGHLEPGQPGYAATLARFAANPKFLGIRVGGSTLAALEDPAVAADLALLAGRGLVLDLIIGVDDYPRAATLARRLGDLRVVINHLGHVPIHGGAPDPRWLAGVRLLAAAPGVWMKVSGFVEQSTVLPAPEDPAFYAPTFDSLWDAFGQERLVFGSNWPVCERGASLAVAVGIAAAYFRDRGSAAWQQCMAGNARRVYQWPEPAG